MSQAKAMAGVIRISAMVNTVNNGTICTVVIMVMRVCRDVSGESGDKLVYVFIVWQAQRNYVEQKYRFVCDI
jgi:hypothetical protein